MLVEALNAILPQTQCTRCGYPACRPYAEAMATGEAAVDRCPPGGDAGAARLAEVLGHASVAVCEDVGGAQLAPELAFIREAECIGCTKCIQACPVDAILGGPERMHTVLTEHCTGCGLCLPPCPVDCIDIVPAPSRPMPVDYAAESLARHRSRQTREARWAAEDRTRRAARMAERPQALGEGRA